MEGFKFETLATLDRPWSDVSRQDIDNRPKMVVNNIEQYISVVRTGVGNLKVLLGGEVDCVIDYKPNSEIAKKSMNKEGESEMLLSSSSPLSHYVELKTSRCVDTPTDAVKFERKIFKSWAQSFLLGVPKIIYGFRDDNGVLKSVEEFETENMPTVIKNSQYSSKEKKWNGVEAIAFYGAVLDWIKKSITQDGKIWRLSYKAGSNKLDLLPLAEYDNFLSKEFVEWRNELGDGTIST